MRMEAVCRYKFKKFYMLKTLILNLIINWTISWNGGNQFELMDSRGFRGVLRGLQNITHVAYPHRTWSRRTSILTRCLNAPSSSGDGVRWINSFFIGPYDARIWFYVLFALCGWRAVEENEVGNERWQRTIKRNVSSHFGNNSCEPGELIVIDLLLD